MFQFNYSICKIKASNPCRSVNLLLVLIIHKTHMTETASHKSTLIQTTKVFYIPKAKCFVENRKIALRELIVQEDGE